MSDRYDNYEPALRSTEDDAVAQAARTMLSLLKRLVDVMDERDRVVRGVIRRDFLKDCNDAIAAAEAAGIKETE